MTEACPTRPDAPPDPLAPDLPAQWCLDRDVTFLNHGCFGARPVTVARAQDQWRQAFEQRPIDFLDRDRDRLMAQAKAPVAALLNMAPEDFGLVTNATEGINAVLRSLSPDPGDVLLTTTHVYNAVRKTMQHVCAAAGAVYREIDVPLPLQGAAAIVERIERALDERVRLLVIDHVTSPTAVRFPIERILETAASRNIDVLVDGAHAPGMLELDVAGLGAAYYAGNLHKWVSAPVGTAFLWVRSDRQAGVHPTTISHFYEEGLASEFAWQGTRDISGWLAAGAAIDYFTELGWERVRDHNHRLAVWVQRLLCERWSVQPATPLDGSMLGSMVTVALPAGVERFESPEALQAALYDGHRIEVPIIPWAGRWWTRPCCQIYNHAGQYEQLADAMLDLAAEG